MRYIKHLKSRGKPQKSWEIWLHHEVLEHFECVCPKIYRHCLFNICSLQSRQNMFLPCYTRGVDCPYQTNKSDTILYSGCDVFSMSRITFTHIPVDQCNLWVKWMTWKVTSMILKALSKFWQLRMFTAFPVKIPRRSWWPISGWFVLSSLVAVATNPKST